MEVLLRLVSPVLSEPSVVHEKIGPLRQSLYLVRGTSVDGIDDLQTGAWILDNLVRRDLFPFDVDLFAHLKLFPQGSLRDAQSLCLFRVKPARPIGLDNSVREACYVVRCFGCLDVVAVSCYFFSWFEFCGVYVKVVGESSGWT